MTLNDSKGLEFQFVAVVGLEEGRLPTTPSLNILDEDAKRITNPEKTSILRCLLQSYESTSYMRLSNKSFSVYKAISIK